MINVTQSSLPPLGDYTKYLGELWRNKWITNNGRYVIQLRKKLVHLLKVKHLSLLSNGTMTMLLAIKALDLRGEIITTPFTFPATTNVILWHGLTPVFADIDPDTFNIDPADIEKKITKKTSAILAVHVYGNPCNVDAIAKIAKKHKIKVIYDAAHAFGVEYKNKSVLDYGDISSLSFHATKVFNTIEGGAVISKSKSLIRKIDLLRNFGIVSEEKTVMEGINCKMNEFEAIMGICSLKMIEKNILLRKKIYERYQKNLQFAKSIKFQTINSSKYNYAYMPVCFDNKKVRDTIYSRLLNENIKARKYFYPLISDFDFIKKKSSPFKRYELDNARKISDGILCLPIYPSLDINDVDKISDIILKRLD